ncbi:MAG: DUF418 domain-containing protein, partial [Alloalcanivorax venustensis]
FARGAFVALSCAGRQALTLYIAHIYLGMGVLEALGLLGNQTADTALIASLVFALCALLYCLLWQRFYSHGPLEALLRKMV